MKLNQITLTQHSVSTKGSNFGLEDHAQRTRRMQRFWAGKDTAQIFKLGQILKIEVEGKSLAQYVHDGETVEMEAVHCANGVVLPLKAGFALSLKTIKEWGCIACHSAHGSGVKPSPKKSVNGLASNHFYYNPATRDLFTVSNECWGGDKNNYVLSILGKEGIEARFIDVPNDWKPAVPETVPETVPEIAKAGKNLKPAKA